MIVTGYIFMCPFVIFSLQEPYVIIKQSSTSLDLNKDDSIIFAILHYFYNIVST